MSGNWEQGLCNCCADPETCKQKLYSRKGRQKGGARELNINYNEQTEIMDD